MKIILGVLICIVLVVFFYSLLTVGGRYDDNKHICECCDNDSIILIDFTEDTMPNNLGNRIHLCDECKEKLIDLLLPF